MSDPIHSVAPDAYIKFFPFVGEDTLQVFGDAMTTSVVTAKNDIISIDTNKSKSGAGSWSCMLSSNIDYHSVIHPGAWCIIYIASQQLDGNGGAGPESGLKMIGIVKSVRKIEATSQSTGIRTIRYVISGVDVSGVLDMPLYVNNHLSGVDQNGIIAKNFIYGKDSQLQKVKGLALKFLNLIFGVGPDGHFDGTPGTNPKLGYQFAIPSNMLKSLYNEVDGEHFLSFLRTSLQDDLPGEADAQPDIGSVITAWSLLKTYCNPLLNEIFCDIMPDDSGIIRPTLVIRSIPFSKSSGAPASSCIAIKSGNTTNPSSPHKLYVSKVIEEHHILSLNYGKSDSDRFNFFLAVPNSTTALSDSDPSNIISMIVSSGGLTTLSDLNSIKRYGVRPFIGSSIWYYQNPHDLAFFNGIVRDLWNRSHLFDNGLVNIVGSNEQIPVGTNIKFADRNWLAHVESVSHSFAVDSESGKKSFRTNIAFVRLQDLKGEPLFLSKMPPETDPYDRGVTDGNNGFATWLHGAGTKDT